VLQGCELDFLIHDTIQTTTISPMTTALTGHGRSDHRMSMMSDTRKSPIPPPPDEDEDDDDDPPLNDPPPPGRA
jgi:hypothetical protein